MKKLSFHQEISNNKRDSVLLLILVFASLVFIGWFIGWLFDPAFASIGIIIAVIIAVIMTWGGYYYSDKIVLSTINAVPANPTKDQRIINLLDGLCIGAGMPKPRLYIIKSPDINAFATGRNPENSIIGITQGAIDLLNRDEIEGVLAHELSHIMNYDIRFMTLVATVVGVIVIISELFRRSMWYGGSSRDRNNKSGGIILIIGLLFAILAPIMMKLIQLAVSRKREYLADSSAAKVTRNPDGLASALTKISNHNSNRMPSSKAVHHLFIANPLKNIDSIFSTHPPIKERVNRLKNM